MGNFLEHCINVNMNNAVIKILQGCVVTQRCATVTIIPHLQISYSVGLLYKCAKNYENWLRVNKIAMKKVFFGPPCM